MRTRREFDGTIMVVLFTMLAVGGLVKPWAVKKLNQGASGAGGTVAETASVLA